MEQIRMRRAEPSDAEELSSFAARLFRETYADSTKTADLEDYIGKSFHAVQQRSEIADRSGVIFLLVQNGNAGVIRGYAHIMEQPRDETAMLLNRLYVERECRASGLAGRLLDEASAECGRRGITTLRLTVFEKNTRAIAFYKRHGFRVVGEVIFMVGDEAQRDLEMELRINPVNVI